MGNYFDRLKGDEPGCGTYLLIILLTIALVFGISCLYAWIAMLLWNWVMPIIWVEAPVMTFWPMWGLVELCSILFKAKIQLNSDKKD